MRNLALVYVLSFVTCMLCFAEPSVLPVIPNPSGDMGIDYLQLLILSVGGMKGVGTLTIVAMVIQLLIKALSLPVANQWFEKLAGHWKFAVVSGITFAVTPISLMVVDKVSFSSALVHTVTMNAFMVFGNEIYKQATKPKEVIPS